MRKDLNQTTAKMLEVLQILCCGVYARSARDATRMLWC